MRKLGISIAIGAMAVLSPAVVQSAYAGALANAELTTQVTQDANRSLTATTGTPRAIVYCDSRRPVGGEVQLDVWLGYACSTCITRGRQLQANHTITVFYCTYNDVGAQTILRGK